MNSINIKKISATALLLGGVLWLAGTEAQAQGVDFNISTQLTDLRSDGTNNNPGFNPCRGGDRSAAGVCGGAVTANGAATALLDPDNLQTVFPSLGPGAVTDNMFGIISGPDATGIAVTSCGKTSNGALAGLNCGDLRFDPASQGQNLPALTPNTLVTPAGGLDMNTQFIADFCPGPTVGADCTGGTVAAHAGFNLVNNFNFKTLAGGLTAETSGTDNIRQVTALKTTGIGTQVDPGTGDQIFVANTTWATTAANPSSNDPATGPTNLTVTWRQEITDPDQSGTGSGAFTQVIEGSFVYQGTSPAISAQYPSGKTQTERSIGLTPAAGTESLNFALVP